MLGWVGLGLGWVRTVGNSQLFRVYCLLVCLCSFGWSAPKWPLDSMYVGSTVGLCHYRGGTQVSTDNRNRMLLI